jgi:hypothetical protein
MRSRSLSVLSFGLLLLWTAPARADSGDSNDEVPNPKPPYIVTLRGAAGLGGGTGFYMRAALSGEVWVDPYVGVGALWGTSNLTRRMALFGPGDSEADSFLGLCLAARTSPRGSYGQLSLGVAYARGQRDDGYDQYDFSGAPTGNPPSQSFSYSGVMVNVSAAWLFHGGPLEIGPRFDLDVTTWGNVTLTGNLALGVAVD